MGGAGECAKRVAARRGQHPPAGFPPRPPHCLPPPPPPPAVGNPSAAWSQYSNLQWASTGMLMMGVHQLAPRSPGARLVLLGYAFVVLILCSLYVSAM